MAQANGENPVLQPVKLRAIDRAFELVGVRRFADLGGVWAVDGGYAVYALGRPGVEEGTLVDDIVDQLSPETRASGLSLVKSSIADAADELDHLDAVLLFDVLLHQVAPDWDEILRIYGPKTRAFVIVQPQYRGERTVRLIDLGRDEYLRLVHPNEVHTKLFDRLDEPYRGRTWRDAHDVWQWGITNDDLVAAARDAGFDLAHSEDDGPWMDSPHFQNMVFIFTRAAA